MLGNLMFLSKGLQIIMFVLFCGIVLALLRIVQLQEELEIQKQKEDLYVTREEHIEIVDLLYKRLTNDTDDFVIKEGLFDIDE